MFENKVNKPNLQPSQLHKNGLPRKITLISPSAGVNWSGGAENFAIELSRHLSNYYEVELLSGGECGSHSIPISSITRTQSYDVLRKAWIAPLWKSLTNIPEVWLEHATSFLPCALHLLRKPPDLVFPANEFGGLAMAACIRRLKRIPILYTEHGSLIKGGSYLKRNLSFKPDRLVVFSQKVADFVHSVRPQQAVNIIHNGVDLQRFIPSGNRIDFSLPSPVVLCVASLRRTGHKRIELAINAVARMQEASLLICGDGPDRAYYQALGDQLLGSDRFAIRSFPFAAMPEVYRSADVFTLPSENEPCALSYLEAMASGLPVVTTDDEMRRHTVGSGGIVCDVSNANSYAKALTEANAPRWSIQARNNALRFGWDAIACQYKDVIDEVIQSNQTAKSD
jgi:glycosyltransferase involved in cell wall biosynthesis